MPEIVQSDKQVNVSSSAPSGRSKVPFSYRFANTLRFGEYSPFFVMETVNGDKIPFSCRHDLRSYTLKSPVLSDMRIHKDYFNVPMEAILPLNWEKLYTNPVVGDDVVASDVNCLFPMTKAPDAGILYYLKTTMVSTLSANDFLGYLKDFMRYLGFVSYFLSAGSLLNTLGYKCWKLSRKSFSDFQIKFSANDTWSSTTAHDWDTFFDEFLTKFISAYGSIIGISFPDPSSQSSLYYTEDLSRESLLKCIFYTNDWSFTVKTGQTFTPTNFISYGSNKGSMFFGENLGCRSFNLSRLIAYQLVCAHFYTNDKIDYVYSAQLYRENLLGILKKIDSSYISQSFTYNGVDYLYDVLAGKHWNSIITNQGTLCFNGKASSIFDFFSNVFSFNRSLRFVDYFTGARVSPLAVGDVNISVNTSAPAHTSAIDVTRGIQMQRFLNFVNRTGRRFEEYVSKLGGKYVAPDYHNPFVLALTDSKVINSETENTGAGQLSDASSVTSVYRSGDSQFVFEFESDRPSILIGICYFDLPRYYNTVSERQFFHQDRYDMFNPFMQFIGDQEIYEDEYLLAFPSSYRTPTFGYQLRNEEYKLRVDQCAGAFANEYLPSWIYLNNPSSFGRDYISPEFIRSMPFELDKFFVSLTGSSLGHYFHFIVNFTNVCEPVRPMAYQPQIL